MAGDMTEKKPGITTTSENVREWLKADTIDQFNDAFIAEIAAGMMKRRAIMKDATEAEISRAADDKGVGYRNNFKLFWQKRGITVDDSQAAAAWEKVRRKAGERYAFLRMQAEAPPLPARAEEVIEVEPIPEEELRGDLPPKLTEFCASSEWTDKVLTPDILGKFNAGFTPLLGDALKNISDPVVRERTIEAARGLYGSALFPLYQRMNEGFDIAQLTETFQNWLDSVWPKIRLSAELH